MADKKLLARIGADISEFQDKMKTVSKNMKDTGAKFKKIGDKMAGIGKSMTAKVTAPIVGGMVAAVKGTEEYREEMGKLETAFTTNGHSVEDAQKVFKDFYGVLGETDRSVEAVNHLSKLTNTQEELSAWTDIATGVYAQFGDSLPIEGLTEAANETAKTGEITGVLADALNWAGVNEDKFKEKLEGANSEQERQEMITSTLNDLYSDSAEKYREVNGELIKSREASISFKDAMAQLGKTLAPLLVKVTELGTKLLNKFNNLSPTGKKIVGVVVAIVAAIGPLLAIVGTAISLFGSLTTIAGALGVSVAAIAAPIAIAIGAIAAVIAIGDLLWKNWDTIKVKTIEIWNKIKEITTNVWNGIKDFFKAIWEGIKAMFVWYVNMYVSIIKAAWNGIKKITSHVWLGIKIFFNKTLVGIWNTIKNKFKAMNDAITDRMIKIKSTIVNMWSKVREFFTSINLFSIGKDIIQGLINGIRNKIAAVKNAVKSVTSAITGKVKSLLGIHSPSRVLMEMGEYTGEGFALGIDHTVSSVNKSSEKMANAGVPSIDIPQSQENEETQQINEFIIQIGNDEIKDYIVKTSSRGIYEKKRTVSRAKGVVTR